MGGGLLDLPLMEQRHAQIIVCPGVVRIQLERPQQMRHPLLREVFDVVQEEAEFLVGLHVVRVELQRVVVLGNRIVGLAVAIELVAGADERIIVEELLVDLRDRVRAGH